jgi:hypothetical protein
VIDARQRRVGFLVAGCFFMEIMDSRDRLHRRAAAERGPAGAGQLDRAADYRLLRHAGGVHPVQRLAGEPVGDAEGLPVRHRRVHGRLAALTALGLGGLAYAAGLVSQNATPWALVAAVGLPALLALALAIRHLLRAENPLVDLRTLRIATFRVSAGSGALSTMAIAAVPFMLALLFQNVFGWSPVKSGAVMLFVFVGNIGIKPATSFIVNRWGFRRVLLAACLTLSASMVGAAFFTGGTPIALIALTAVVSGIGRSVGGTSYNTLSFALRLGGTLDGHPGSDTAQVRDAGDAARRQQTAKKAPAELDDVVG